MITSFRKNKIYPLDKAWKMFRVEKITNITEIGFCDSVNTFWSVFDQLPEASDIGFNNSYRFFQSTIQPVFEDPANTTGGHWTFPVGAWEEKEINEIFLHLLLAAVGNTFPLAPLGITVNNRALKSNIGVWVRSKEAETQLFIQKLFPARFGALPLTYKPHIAEKSICKNGRGCIFLQRGVCAFEHEGEGSVEEPAPPPAPRKQVRILDPAVKNQPK